MELMHGRKAYVPVVRRGGLLDVRATVSYGPAGSGKFMLSVYVRCEAKGAGSRGGKTDRSMDIPSYREVVPNTMSEEEQRKRLQFALDILAVRMDCGYKLRTPIAPKPTPQGRPRSPLRGMTPMSVLMAEYENQKEY